MANIRIPFLVKKRHSWFWQPSATLAKAGWKSEPLGHDEGKAIELARDINKHVAAWRLGGPGPNDQIRKHVARGTGLELITRYRREYLDARHEHGPKAGQYKLALRTRENYETPLKRLEAWMGDMALETITPKRVKVLRETCIGPEAKGGIGHAASFQLLKMGRQIFAFAIANDIVPQGHNPFLKFGLGAPAARRTIWKPAHEKAFDDAALRLGLPSLALARKLALYTAQREGDLLRFTENDYASIELFDPGLIAHFGDKDGVVRGWAVEQHKTGMPLQIPFDTAMRAEVEKALRTNRARDRAADPPRLVTRVITEERTGLPWKQRHFHTMFRKVLDNAADATGMEDMRALVWHDLRRTRVVRLRQMGMPKEQIATVTGTSIQTIDAMIEAYGPIDATMTAGALAAASNHEAAQAAAIEEKKGKKG